MKYLKRFINFHHTLYLYYLLGIFGARYSRGSSKTQYKLFYGFISSKLFPEKTISYYCWDGKYKIQDGWVIRFERWLNVYKCNV